MTTDQIAIDALRHVSATAIRNRQGNYVISSRDMLNLRRACGETIGTAPSAYAQRVPMSLCDEVLYVAARIGDPTIDHLIEKFAIEHDAQTVRACVSEMLSLEWLRVKDDDQEHDWTYRLADRGSRRFQSLVALRRDYPIHSVHAEAWDWDQKRTT